MGTKSGDRLASTGPQSFSTLLKIAHLLSPLHRKSVLEISDFEMKFQVVLEAMDNIQ